VKSNKIHPKLFALVLGFASIFMMFAGFTSAYVVKKMAGSWLDYEFPSMFYISTIIILTASLTLHLGYYAFKNGKEWLYKTMLLISFVLGVAFLACQYKGFLQITVEQGLSFGINSSVSFPIVMAGVHGAHIIGGLAAILLAIIHAFALKFKFTEVRKLRYQLTLWYWHFVDILWLYLLIFFHTQQTSI